MRIFSIAWGASSYNRLYEVAERQRILIDQQNAEIARMQLEHVRWARDIIEHFRTGLDTTDEDTLRYGLEAALVDLKDEVARMEEQCT